MCCGVGGNLWTVRKVLLNHTLTALQLQDVVAVVLEGISS